MGIEVLRWPAAVAAGVGIVGAVSKQGEQKHITEGTLQPEDALISNLDGAHVSEGLMIAGFAVLVLLTFYNEFVRKTAN